MYTPHIHVHTPHIHTHILHSHTHSHLYKPVRSWTYVVRMSRRRQAWTRRKGGTFPPSSSVWTPPMAQTCLCAHLTACNSYHMPRPPPLPFPPPSNPRLRDHFQVCLDPPSMSNLPYVSVLRWSCECVEMVM